MNKVYKKQYDETYYEEKLDNGLEVIICHKPEYEATMACFGTPFGSLNLKEYKDGKTYSFNPGVAHFLEHKLFETEGKDILHKFSILGSNVNAFTSYNETIYFFYKSSNDIEEDLNLLLDFVQDLDITKESVEKEKNIICEELDMYLKNPSTRLMNETFKSLYYNFPLNIDIGGTNKSVKEISYEELNECYKLNYHPNNMLLLVATPIDPLKIMGIIKDNQSKKTFTYEEKPITVFEKEPYEVKRKEFSIYMDVAKTKTCYAFKLKPTYKTNLEAIKEKFCLYFYLEAYFSEMNDDYQKWLDEEIINDYFGFDISLSKDAGFIIFTNENDDKDTLKKLVDTELKKNLFSENVLNQIKHRIVGESLRDFNSIENLAIEFARLKLEGIDYFKMIDDIMSITYDDVINAASRLDFENYALVHIEKEK